MTSRTQHQVVYEGGAGEPLVLLHGVGAFWEIWKPVIPLLEMRYRVIVPNLPGHPGGVALNGEPSVMAMADRLVEQLQNRGLVSAHVAGNSLGGWLAIELGRRGFARSVTALSPAGGWQDEQAYRDLVHSLLVPFKLMPLIYRLAWPFMYWGAVRRALSAETMMCGDRVPVSEFRKMLKAFMHCRMMPQLFANTGPDAGVQPFALGTLPLAIYWSENDRVVPFERYGRKFLSTFPDARMETLAAAGHVPMYDAPEAVARAIVSTAV